LNDAFGNLIGHLGGWHWQCLAGGLAELWHLESLYATHAQFGRRGFVGHCFFAFVA
jgi:hypothetical protein